MYHSFRLVRNLGITLALLAVPGLVFAQDDGHVQDLRNQLQNNKLAAPMETEEFSTDEQELMDAESALIRQLQEDSEDIPTAEEGFEKASDFDPRASANLEAAIEAERQALERLQDGRPVHPVAAVGHAEVQIKPAKSFDSGVKRSLGSTNSQRENYGESQPSVKETAKLVRENSGLEDKIKTQEQSLSNLRKDKVSLKGQLANSQAELRKLRDELTDTRNKLIIAEAEVQQLSRVLKKRDASNMARYGGGSGTTSVEMNTRSFESSPPLRKVETTRINEYDRKVTPEMRVATVVVPKANLRTGPGLNNSPLMTVLKGTRLAVELRKGEWYRVITPTGARAWVSGDVIEFGKGLQDSPMVTRRSKGYESGIEQEAHELYNRESK